MTGKVALKKLSARVTRTSTEHCGWGRAGNGFVESARWAALKGGTHVATTYSVDGFWSVVHPVTWRLFATLADRRSAVRWIANNL